MRLILAMIQVICLMTAQSTDYGNQSRLIRRLLCCWGRQTGVSQVVKEQRQNVRGNELSSVFLRHDTLYPLYPVKHEILFISNPATTYLLIAHHFRLGQFYK